MRRVGRVGLMALVAGCYDSTWGETKGAQGRGALAATPSQINKVAFADDEGRAITVPTHPYRVRAYVSPRYQGQTVDWNHALRSTIDDANQVLAAGVGVRLEVVSADGDYFGTPVVIAKRLCDQAGAGQTLVSGVVRTLVGSRGDHRFDPRGAVELKGIADPVEVFALA